jgi:putative N6-adenine-specific DNA methylase
VADKKTEKKRLFASTLHGLEPLLEAELTAMGCKNVETSRRGVYFDADYREMVRVNLSSRFAIRVLIPWAHDRARTTDDLYKVALRMPWDRILTPRSTFAIDSVVNSKEIDHSHFASLRLKDGIVDQFRKRTGKRPSIDLENPDVRIHMRVHDDNLTISLDSSGDSLHRRGYRPAGAIAPLNECLAAGLIAFSGWTPDKPLYVPMCGSGTLVMEAALLAANLPSQWFRTNYGFLRWKNLDERIVREERARLWQQRNPRKVKIFASDNDRKAIRQTTDSVKKIAWEHDIDIRQVDFFEHPQPDEPGTVLLNPPYGERIQPEDIQRFYADMGSKLKHDFPGSEAWIISSNMDALNYVGFKSHTKHKLYNGKLECLYAGFELYEGSKKKSKQD